MLGDTYATLADLKTYLGSTFATSTEFDTPLTWALQAATEKIEGLCERQFNTDGVVSTRVFMPGEDPRFVEVDDFVLTDGFVLMTDPSGNGDFDVTWSAPLDYELSTDGGYANGVVEGQPGWPYNEIHAVAGVWFPLLQFRRNFTVSITAQWGWNAVPNAVHQSCLVMAAEQFKIKDAPFGVAGMTQFGGVVKVRDNPMAEKLLAKYMRYPIKGG